MALVCSLLSVMRFLRFASCPMRPAICPMRDARWFLVKATCSLLYVTRCLLAAFWPLRVCYMLASLQELRSAPWSTHHALCSLPHLLHDACPLIFVLYQMRYALGLIITYARCSLFPVAALCGPLSTHPPTTCLRRGPVKREVPKQGFYQGSPSPMWIFHPLRSLPPLASRKEASAFFEISQSRGRRARRTSSCRSSRPPATRQGRVLPHSFAAARQRARNSVRLETSPRRYATPPSSRTYAS